MIYLKVEIHNLTHQCPFCFGYVTIRIGDGRVRVLDMSCTCNDDD